MQNKPTVGWTQAHLDDLERMFPEIPYSGDVNELLVQSGKREVISVIANIVRSNKKPVHD